MLQFRGKDVDGLSQKTAKTKTRKTHRGQSPDADGGASSSHVSSDPCCSEVVSLRNLPAAGFQKVPMGIFGVERIFGVGESFFRRFFLNTLKVLECFLDVF